MNDMAKVRPNLIEGWRSTPTWMRGLIGAATIINVAGAVWLLLIGLSPLVWAVGIAVNVIVLWALIGTITDAFAAPEAERALKLRSLAIGAALVVLIAAFFAASIVRLGGNVFNRAL